MYRGYGQITPQKKEEVTFNLKDSNLHTSARASSAFSHWTIILVPRGHTLAHDVMHVTVYPNQMDHPVVIFLPFSSECWDYKL